MKRILALDLEVYPNFFLAKFKAEDTGKSRDYILRPDFPLELPELKAALGHYTIVTFNGNGYDIPMITLALAGASNEKLKQASDWLIVGKDGQGNSAWDFYNEFGVSKPDWIDHIDLIEVAPGQASLKLYGGRLHSKRLQDLPLPPDRHVSQREQEILIAYCENDLDTTLDLYHRLKPQIDLRGTMSAEYGIDLRSKSDAQIAEAVIRKEVSKLLGSSVSRPDIPPGTAFHYTPPAFIQFKTDPLYLLLVDIASAQFVIDNNGSPIEPPELSGRTVTIGSGVYRLGIGGLHSSETCTAHIADEDTLIIDRDVASYYPAIVLNCKLYPEHLTDAFLTVYRKIVMQRLAAKRSDDKVTADALKITINGSFGKLGSKWSALYSPNLMIQVTVTGQLSLLMLIEAIEGVGIPVVSANTDGIVIKCPRSRYDDLGEVIAWWEGVTGFETEETRYRALYSRDVNNYVAIKQKGGAKGKGAFADIGLQKNPQNIICVEAVKALLEHGTPIAQTIINCQDIRKFLVVRTVRGGAVQIINTNYDDRLTPSKQRALLLDHGWFQVVKGPLKTARFDVIPDGCGYDVETAYRMHCGEDDVRYVGKVVRYYYALGVEKALYYQTKNNKGGRNKVPSSEGAMPLMELGDTFPVDLDYGRYIAEANGILKDIGALK